MELRTLRYFVATVDAGSVSAAADLVHVSQPSLSRQLRQLEQGLSIQLFVRRGGRLSLSAAGRQFLPIARDLLVRADKATHAAASFAAGALDAIAISAPTTTLMDVIAPFLATWGADDPVPTVVESDFSDAASALLAGADLSIVSERPSRSHSSMAIAELPLWAYVRDDHPWAGRSSIPVYELARETVIAMTPSFKPRKILDAAIAHEGLSIANLVESTNAQVAQALAAAGRGIAVVSDDSRFGLVPISIEGSQGPINIHLFAAWDPDHHAAPTIGNVADRLRLFCELRYGT